MNLVDNIRFYIPIKFHDVASNGSGEILKLSFCGRATGAIKLKKYFVKNRHNFSAFHEILILKKVICGGRFFQSVIASQWDLVFFHQRLPPLFDFGLLAYLHAHIVVNIRGQFPGAVKDVLKK